MSEIQDKYMSLGGESGWVGRPLHGERSTPDGRGRYQTFCKKGGWPISIHWTKETGAHVTYGAIRSFWESKGWERGCLGYPTSDEADYNENGIKGRISHFQGGALVWDAVTNRVAIYTHDSDGTLQKENDGSKSILENTVIGATVIGGATAAVVGGVSAAATATAAISAAGGLIGATVGGIAAGVVGSGIGIATGGTAIAGTVPLAIGGASIGGAVGSWAGPVLAVFGIGTAPVWAMPVAIAGGVFAIGGLACGVYKVFKSKKAGS